MSLINALPFDGVSIGSSTWREFQRRHLAFHRAASASDGLIYSQAESGLKVAKVNATTVSVSAGSGWANGLAFWNDAAKNLAVAAAHATYTRYDYVVMRADMISKTAQLYVIQGTPAASPVEPTPDKSGAPYYDVPLALLTIAPGTGISVVSERREFISNAAGIHRIVRNAGSVTLYPGDIVVWYTFDPWDVTTTNVVGSPNTAGVIASIIPPGGYGLMTVYGIGLVHLNITSGPGTRVGTSTVGRRAAETPTNWICTLLESGAPGSVVRCWVDTTQLMERVITLVNGTDQSTTLTTPEYVNGLSSAFDLRWGGRVRLSARGLAYYSGTVGPVVEFSAAIDGTESRIWFTGNTSVDYRGLFYAEHIFDNIAAGTHTAGLKWRVTTGGNTGFLKGSSIGTVVQIMVL